MGRFDDHLINSLGPAEQFKKLKLKKIVESKENTEINIVIITSRNESKKDNLFITAQRLVDTCSKKHIPYYVLFIENSHIIKDDNGDYTIHNWNDKKGFSIDPDKTVVINRGSVMQKKSSLNIISQLEKANIFCINDRAAIETCSDKYRTMLKMGAAAITSPKTALLQSMDTLDYALEQLDSDFPYIVKTISGSKGVGVFFSESMKSLTSILQVIWKINEEEELLIQEFISAPFDIRAHVLGDEVIASMKRFVIKDDFRSNYSQGGKIKAVKLTDEEKDICIKASKAVGATWGGVDFISNKKGEPFILEVNSSPGTAGIEEATGQDITGEVIDWVLNKDNWIKVANEIGFKETVEFDGEEIIAKFDTGNGSLCVMHADSYDINEKNKTVTWTYNKKKFKHPYKKIKDVHVGGMRDYTEKRPIVELDIIFDGIIFKEIDFTLDDRSKRTHMLINRRFMRKANVMVNAAKSFVVTTKPEKIK